MLSQKIKEALKKNWGDKANALDCFCEVKLIDELSGRACYIFALNPADEDEIDCIVDHKLFVEITRGSLKELESSYNEEGEFPIIDNEFRRIRAAELYKRLKIDG